MPLTTPSSLMPTILKINAVFLSTKTNTPISSMKSVTTVSTTKTFTSISSNIKIAGTSTSSTTRHPVSSSIITISVTPSSSLQIAGTSNFLSRSSTVSSSSVKSVGSTTKASMSSSSSSKLSVDSGFPARPFVSSVLSSIPSSTLKITAASIYKTTDILSSSTTSKISLITSTSLKVVGTLSSSTTTLLSLNSGSKIAVESIPNTSMQKPASAISSTKYLSILPSPTPQSFLSSVVDYWSNCPLCNPYSECPKVQSMKRDSPCCYCNKNTTCIDLILKSDKSWIIDPLTINETPKVSWCPCYPYSKCPSQGFNSNSDLWGTCYCDPNDSTCLEIQASNGFYVRPPIQIKT